MGTDTEARLQAALVTVANGAKVTIVGLALDRLFVTALAAVLSTGVGAAAFGLYEIGFRLHRFLAAAPRGFGIGVLRFLPNRETAVDRSRTLILGAAGSVAVGAVLGSALVSTAPWLTRVTGTPVALTRTLRWMGVAVPLAAAATVGGAVLRVRHDIVTHILLLRVCYPGGRLVAAVVVVAVGAGAAGAAAGTVAALALVAGIVVVVVWHREELPAVSPASEPAVARRFCVFGTRMSLSSLGTGIQKFGFFPVLAYYVSPTAAGFFGVAYVLSSFVRWPLRGVNRLVPPVAADLYGDGERDALHRLHAVSSRLVVLIALPIAAVLLVNGRAVLGLFNPVYVQYAWLLPFFLTTRVVEAGVGSVGFLLTITDNDRAHLRLNLLLTPVAVAVMVGLTATFGLAGAAAAFLLVRVTNNTAQLVILAWLEGFQPFTVRHLQPLGAAGVATVPTLLVAGAVSGAAGIGMSAVVTGVTYGAIIRASGVKAVDRTVLRAVIGSTPHDNGAVGETPATDSD